MYQLLIRGARVARGSSLLSICEGPGLCGPPQLPPILRQLPLARSYALPLYLRTGSTAVCACPLLQMVVVEAVVLVECLLYMIRYLADGLAPELHTTGALSVEYGPLPLWTLLLEVLAVMRAS